jgi:uncharacterized repeat protein (TIGR03809 family)
MSARPSIRPYDTPARKWRDLAERRRQHLVELCESGRWRRYYTEAQFLFELHAAIRAAEAWQRIAPEDTAAEAHHDGAAIGMPAAY